MLIVLAPPESLNEARSRNGKERTGEKRSDSQAAL